MVFWVMLVCISWGVLLDVDDGIGSGVKDEWFVKVWFNVGLWLVFFNGLLNLFYIGLVWCWYGGLVKFDVL